MPRYLTKPVNRRFKTSLTVICTSVTGVAYTSRASGKRQHCVKPRIANLFLHTHYANGEGRVKYPWGYLEFQDTHGQNFNDYIHVFEVQLFNGVVDDVMGSRVKPEIDMAAVQTGSNTISAHRTSINKLPTPTSIFSMSPGSTTLSPTQPEVALYRKYVWRWIPQISGIHFQIALTSEHVAGFRRVLLASSDDSGEKRR